MLKALWGWRRDRKERGEDVSIVALIKQLFEDASALLRAELRLAHERGERRQNLRAARPDVPSRLAAVIGRAIDPDPSKRYENATSLAAALTAVGSRESATRRRIAIAVAGLALVTAVLARIWPEPGVEGRTG